MAERRDDAFEFKQVRVRLREERLRAFERDAEDESRCARSDGQLRLPVVDVESAVAVRESEFLAFEHAPELLAEYGQQHAVFERGVRRVPVNIEVARELRARPILKKVLPPAVLRACDAHVVRHNVHEHAHPALAKCARQLRETLLAARLRVDLRVVNDVVAV